MTGLLAAVQFLTRVPVRSRCAPSSTAAVPWFPVAGALIGAAAGGSAAALWHVVPPLLAGSLGVALGLLLTGAFHEDGLADVADAFGGGWTVERRFEILKDPRHGTYGVAAMCASIVVRVVALGSMPGPAAMLWSAVAVHALARGAAVGLMRAVAPASRAGLGADHANAVSRSRAAVGALAGLVLAAGALGVRFGWDDRALASTLVVAAAAVLAAGATAALAVRKIGGTTGDVLGAAEQVVECVALAVLASTRWT